MPVSRKYASYDEMHCPLPDCKFTSLRRQGLVAHVRAVHPIHYRRHGAEPGLPSENTPDEVVEAPGAGPAGPPPPWLPPSDLPPVVDPLELLDAALSALKARQATITVEMERLTALQGEASVINDRIDALEKARAAFHPAG